MYSKILISMTLTGMALALLSFVDEENPKMKRYEVIRSVNGEVQTFDTLVPENSAFTPEQYLAQLGFSEDNNIEIIHMNFRGMPHEMIMNSEVQHPEGSKMVMRFDGEPSEVDSMIIIEVESTGGEPSWSTEEGMDHMIIEKNCVIKQLDSINGELVEIEKIIEMIIVDSLFNAEMMAPGDSNVIIMQHIVINDETGDKNSKNIEWKEGEPSFERHINTPNGHENLIVFSGDENFTLVVVTNDAESKPKSEIKIENTPDVEDKLKVYPNPAGKQVTVALKFDESASTTIRVSDANGKEIALYDLGIFSGQMNQIIDISKWSKGMYFVQVERPGVKLVEKLVVE
jgi:hypothetical protein